MALHVRDVDFMVVSNGGDERTDQRLCHRRQWCSGAAREQVQLPHISCCIDGGGWHSETLLLCVNLELDGAKDAMEGV
jgi:hypothetical protein